MVARRPLVESRGPEVLSLGRRLSFFGGTRRVGDVLMSVAHYRDATRDKLGTQSAQHGPSTFVGLQCSLSQCRRRGTVAASWVVLGGEVLR